MNLFETIKESVKNEEPLFLLSLSASKDEILEAYADTLANIINSRVLHTSDGKPCRCYCIDCGKKGVSLAECHKQIKGRLLRCLNN